MKYLHRNRMKQFYGDYSKNNTTPSKGQHHDHHHIRIMNEDLDGNTEVSNLKEAELEEAELEEAELESQTIQETEKPVIDTPKKETVKKKKIRESPTRKEIEKNLNSQGIVRIKNPKTGNMVLLRNKNITTGYLLTFYKS